MENLTVNNIAIQSILNFNIDIFINLVFYSGAVAGAGAIILLITKAIIFCVRYKWTSKYERRMEDIKELNRKTHDRLVELMEIVESDTVDRRKYNKIKTRLNYSSSRLEKYDETISSDINNLFNLLSFDNSGLKVSDKVKLENIANIIRKKIDILWVKKS